MQTEPLTSVPSLRLDEHLQQRLASLYPEKSAYLGPAGLQSLIKSAANRAQQYATASDGGVMLWTALMFILGSGEDRDPQFPWVQKNSRNLTALYSEAMSYLKLCV